MGGSRSRGISEFTVTVADFTELTLQLDGSSGTLWQLQATVRRWRGVVAHTAAEGGEPFGISIDTQCTNECPIVRQPVTFFQLVLMAGSLIHSIGRLAACSRFFRSRRSQELWDQRALEL